MIKNPGFVGLGRRALRALAVFLAVALSTVVSRPSFAIDTIRFDRLNVVDGLSQGTVQTVVQDARGFIWLGTQEGLNRYDGHEFMVFVNDPDDPHSIHHSFVHAIFVDAGENVWVGTAHGGLDRYDRNTSHFQHFGPELGLTGPVRAIVQDNTGYLWIGTDNTGVVRLDPETGRHTPFRHVPDELDSLSSNRVTALDYGDDGLIWVATDHGLNRLHPSTAMVDRFSITDRLRHLARAGSHGLWLASYEDGLLYLDLATREVRRYRHDPGDPTSLSSNSIRAVMIDRRGSLWVGTDGGGLDRYEPQSNSFTRFLHDSANSTSLNSDHVSALLQDSGGVIWVGTNVGVAKWNPMVGSFATIARRSGDRHELSDNTVTSFAPEGTSKLWVGTLGGGVNLLDLGTNRAIHYRRDSTAAALSDDRVMALARDPSGSLWIGTKGGGLNLLDPRSNQVKHFIHDPTDDSSLSADGVTSLLIDTSGTLWVGTFTGGLHRLNPDGETFTRYSTADPDAPGALSSDRVVAIYQDRRGDLWIGTYGGGLMRMNLQTSDVVTFNHDAGDPASLSSDVAWAIHEDSVGNLWVGTLDAGLNVWRGDRRADVEPRFERFTMTDGLPSATVYAILTDSTGAIWVSTNGGLASLNRGATQFRRYDLSYGLPDTQFNHGASLYVSSTMFFGGMSGFTAFEPDNIRINEHAPSVVLTRFLRFNERASIEDLLDDEGYVTLNHEDRMITFEYAAMDFTAPQRNRYRHRLVGFDRGWVDDGKVRRA
ncbi:MAG: hypothetical protein O7H39_18245, partial [Gammaproteobacteria bacterium]|nr:hypothetical protein [Gammaproteobacteria bacterium]